jgi:hypothetical protein
MEENENKLDESKPYGTIRGHKRYAYEQGGEYFDSKKRLIRRVKYKPKPKPPPPERDDGFVEDGLRSMAWTQLRIQCRRKNYTPANKEEAIKFLLKHIEGE